jgi:colanic acid biosynthesis glycosyl transferase WcaI
MHLLMIVPHYAPDLGPSAPLFTMLAETLTQRGHQVTVLTTVPHYPSGKVQANYEGKPTVTSIENGVKIIRVALPSINRTNLAQRLIQFICYQVGATWNGRKEPFDAAFVANPALWVWLPFWWLVTRRHKPSIFSIYDLYPNVGIDLGIFRNNLVVKAVGSLERFCLMHSSMVRIISESFRPGLRALGVPDGKIELVYDYVDTGLIQPLPRNNDFARENHLGNRFVILYAGNLGLSQGLENVLETAKLLSSDMDMQFVFVGDGTGRDELVARAGEYRLPNVLFLPFQPRQRLPEVLASADVSLVILRRGIGIDSLPNKILSILASGRPVIASVDKESETWKLVTHAQAGICVPPEDPAKIAEAILNLKQEPGHCGQFGKNGRLWVEQYHSPQSAARQFEELFQRALISK